MKTCNLGPGFLYPTNAVKNQTHAYMTPWPERGALPAVARQVTMLEHEHLMQQEKWDLASKWANRTCKHNPPNKNHPCSENDTYLRGVTTSITFPHRNAQTMRRLRFPHRKWGRIGRSALYRDYHGLYTGLNSDNQITGKLDKKDTLIFSPFYVIIVIFFSQSLATYLNTVHVYAFVWISPLKNNAAAFRYRNERFPFFFFPQQWNVEAYTI